MNKTRVQALDLTQQLSSFLQKNQSPNSRIVLAPSSIYLPAMCQNHNIFSLAAQDISFEDSGAYTGEISVSMLSEYIEYTLIGHSERRCYFHETDAVLRKKLNLALQYNVSPIFCFGENKKDRDSGDYLSVIEKQLENTVMHFSDQNFSGIILAYEPVWAIGTGENALPDQIDEVHFAVRKLIAKKTNNSCADSVPILYGGSCNPDNANIILSQPNVNGLLIGGASLSIDHFCKIINISNSFQK